MLTPIPLEHTEPAISGRLTRFISAAERCAARWIGEAERFECSDSMSVWIALQQCRALAPGPRFCEWGAGLGLAAGLAAMAGFTATGVEINADLVTEAHRLLREFELDVDIRVADYADAPRADLVFAYPWPDEEEAIMKRFDETEAGGSLLLLYRGLEDLRLHQKV